MIISHKYKFIFIKTMKTAGTSIEVFLSRFCGSRDVVTPIWPKILDHYPRNYRGLWNPLIELKEILLRGGGLDRINNSSLRQIGSHLKLLGSQLLHANRYYNHIPGWRIQCRISPAIWSNYFRFCVDRNPFEKTLSHYFMLNKLAGNNLELSEYFSRKIFCLNYPLYSNRNGELLVHRVLRYENLDNDLNDVCSTIGIPWPGTLAERMKADYRSDYRSYDEILTPEQIQIIRKVFSTEFAVNGY